VFVQQELYDVIRLPAMRQLNLFLRGSNVTSASKALTTQCRRQDVIRSSSSVWCPLRQAEPTTTPGGEEDMIFLMTSSIPIDTRHRDTGEHICSVIMIKKHKATTTTTLSKTKSNSVTQGYKRNENLQVLFPVMFLP